MQFSNQQEDAIDAVGRWLRRRETQVFRLFGYAGTGKTTLAKHFAETANVQPAFAAFSGKAAKVMRDKGCVGANTIHGLIYAPEQDEKTGLVTFKRSDKLIRETDLVIIDECSMVGEELGKDLLSFKKPILVLGDPAQLPPVGNEGGYFTDAKPDVMLDEVHRQAQESNILKLATQIRNGKMPTRLFESTDLTITRNISVNQARQADTLLVGKNATRAAYNAKIRRLKKIEGTEPREGDLLICLKNDKEMGLFNGSLWYVHEMKKPKNTAAGKLLYMELRSADNSSLHIRVQVFEAFFKDPEAAKKMDWRDLRESHQFDFGYAITVHKSQGSQWDNVVLFDESATFRSDRFAWLYTGVTRAAKHLTLAL